MVLMGWLGLAPELASVLALSVVYAVHALALWVLSLEVMLPANQRRANKLKHDIELWRQQLNTISAMVPTSAANTHSHTLTYTHTHPHTLTYTHTLAHTHTHTLTHSHTHTDTQTHRHSHTHTLTHKTRTHARSHRRCSSVAWVDRMSLQGTAK